MTIYEAIHTESDYHKAENVYAHAFRDSLLIIDLENAMKPGRECRRWAFYVSLSHMEANCLCLSHPAITEFPPPEHRTAKIPKSLRLRDFPYPAMLCIVFFCPRFPFPTPLFELHPAFSEQKAPTKVLTDFRISGVLQIHAARSKYTQKLRP